MKYNNPAPGLSKFDGTLKARPSLKCKRSDSGEHAPALFFHVSIPALDINIC
jgi:hypothetical protein